MGTNYDQCAICEKIIHVTEAWELEGETYCKVHAPRFAEWLGSPFGRSLLTPAERDLITLGKGVKPT